MGFFRRIVMLGRRSRMEREIEAELNEHRQMAIDDGLAQGMSREDAEREARLRFGSPAATRERVSAEDAALGIESLWQDVRLAIRGFLKNPGFAVVVILTLALGLGANTAIFELLDAVRLRALPIARPNELAEIRLSGGNPTGLGVWDGYFANFTVPMWLEFKDHHDPFSSVFAWRENDVQLGQRSEARQANGLEVSGDFFNALGVPPWQGRLIEPQDVSSCQITKVVASYAFWKSQMGGIPITASTTMIVEGRSAQVLGVTPPSFFGMVVGDRFDLAYPTCVPPNPRREAFVYSVMGRLKPGWSLKQASEYLNALSPGLFDKTTPVGYSPDAVKIFKSFRLAAYPAGSGVSYLRNQYNTSLELLLAITGLVLLIACANLANLMLARASAKQREVVVRMALGATRGRILCQMLVESAILAFFGAVLGVALAQPFSRLLVSSLDTSQSSLHLTVVADWRVMLFAAAVAVATCIAFGTLPALRSTRAEPSMSMKSGGRGMVGSRDGFRLQRTMVVVQVAVSMVLLVGALLFVRSYRNLLTFNPGLREKGIELGFFNLSAKHIKPENLSAYKTQLVDDVRALPGVENAAGTTFVPLGHGSWSHHVDVGAVNGSSKFSYVSPSYFGTLDIPLLSGRNFTEHDTNDAPYVLIVNQTFLRRFVAGVPLGQHVHVRPEPQYPDRTYTIIGTIPDTRYSDLRDPTPPMAFAPLAQLPVTAQGPFLATMIASHDPSAAADAVRQLFEQRYPGLEMQFFDFEQQIRDNLVGDRLMAMLSGSFGALAAVLVVVGLYGILSYFIVQRRSEIGIRIALGASRNRVIGELLRDATEMLAIGLILGTCLALLAGREAASMVFGLRAWDPATLGSAGLLLAVVTVVASLVPAWRAANVNPVESLRTE